MSEDISNERTGKGDGWQALEGRIELLVKIGASLVALSYGFGFLIVSVHHSLYGIPELDLLRAKILAAGFTYVALTAVSAFVTFRTCGIGLWGGSAFLTTNPSLSTPQEAVAGSLVFCGALGFSQLYVPVLFTTSTLLMGKSWLAIGLGVMLVVGIAIVERWELFNRFAILIALGSMAVSCAIAWKLWSIGGGQLVAICGWFALMGISCVDCYRASLSKERHLTQWERGLVWAVTLVLLYGRYVYPETRAMLGGGETVPVTIYFTSNDLVFRGQQLDTRLIDANEHGYYVTDNAASRMSYFIPREKVSTIRFGIGPIRSAEAK